ncbi:TPA: hypothetical protein WHE39_001725, partial [Neisseria meningitidis]
RQRRTGLNLIHYNPVAYGKIKVQSWKERRDFNIVKQDLDFSCGAASVATAFEQFLRAKADGRGRVKKTG